MAKLKRHCPDREGEMYADETGEWIDAEETCAEIRQFCRERMNDLRARRAKAGDEGKNALRAGLNEAIQEVQRMQFDLCHMLGAGDPSQEEPQSGPWHDKRGLADPEGGPCE